MRSWPALTGPWWPSARSVKVERSGRRAAARRRDVAGEQYLDTECYNGATCPVAPANITEGWNDEFQLARLGERSPHDVGSRRAIRFEMQRAITGCNERREAPRVSAELFARGCSRSAHSPERSARRGRNPARGGAIAAPSVRAFQRSGTTRGVQQSGVCVRPATPRGGLESVIGAVVMLSTPTS